MRNDIESVVNRQKITVSLDLVGLGLFKGSVGYPVRLWSPSARLRRTGDLPLHIPLLFRWGRHDHPPRIVDLTSSFLSSHPPPITVALRRNGRRILWARSCARGSQHPSGGAFPHY